MKGAGELLISFDEACSEFSRAWKKASDEGAAKSIHSLRTSARRAIAILQLIEALSKDGQVVSLRGRFKRFLKLTSPLRDIQVELDRVSHEKTIRIDGFKRYLERARRRETRRVQKKLSSRVRRRLFEMVDRVRSEVCTLVEAVDDAKVKRAVERVLRVRRNEFFKLRRSFRPSDEGTLHEMRIGLKRWRYAAEAVQPLLSQSLVLRPSDMRSFQRLMGEARDLEILGRELLRWASKNGEKKAAAQAIDRLKQRRARLLKRIEESLPALQPAVLASHPPQIAEKTSAVASRSLVTAS